jgi:hypothetical protein
MKPGLALGAMMVAATVGLAPAQNLGLGTGSRASTSEDSTAAMDGRGEDAPRKSQLNRRLGLGARRKDFDPKVFEARGRELQGQFYEIGTPAGPKEYGSSPMPGGGSASTAIRKDGSKQWLFWVGVAGVAGTSAGVVGYLMMNKAHPSPPAAKPLVLTDEP